MTDSEINEAVALLEGWRFIEGPGGNFWIGPSISVPGEARRYRCAHSLITPDYCNDPALWGALMDKYSIDLCFDLDCGDGMTKRCSAHAPYPDRPVAGYRDVYQDECGEDDKPGRAVCLAYLALNGQPVTEESA